MKIACDVDGVLLNFSKGFQKFVWKEHGSYISHDPTSWSYDPTLNISAYMEQYVASGIFTNLEFLEKGINRRFNELAFSHTVDIVTSFWEHLSDERLENLSDFNYENIYFTEDKVKWFKDTRLEHNYELIIDDKPDIIEEMSSTVPVLFPVTSYNKSLIGKNNCYPYLTFEEIYDILGEV